MIHILSQDGARMVNAEQIVSYEIKERMVCGKPHNWEYDVNALLPYNSCVLGTFIELKHAKEIIRMLGEKIACSISGNKLLIIPTENDLIAYNALPSQQDTSIKISAGALAGKIKDPSFDL